MFEEMKQVHMEKYGGRRWRLEYTKYKEYMKEGSYASARDQLFEMMEVCRSEEYADTLYKCASSLLGKFDDDQNDALIMLRYLDNLGAENVNAHRFARILITRFSIERIERYFTEQNPDITPEKQEHLNALEALFISALRGETPAQKSPV